MMFWACTVYQKSVPRSKNLNKVSGIYQNVLCNWAYLWGLVIGGLQYFKATPWLHHFSLGAFKFTSKLVLVKYQERICPSLETLWVALLLKKFVYGNALDAG